MTTAKYIGPTDTEFYANHDTAVLEALAERIGREGAYVAMNSGADHPIAKEYGAMLAAVMGELLRRDMDKIVKEVTA